MHMLLEKGKKIFPQNNGISKCRFFSGVKLIEEMHLTFYFLFKEELGGGKREDVGIRHSRGCLSSFVSYR